MRAFEFTVIFGAVVVAMVYSVAVEDMFFINSADEIKDLTACPTVNLTENGVTTFELTGDGESSKKIPIAVLKTGYGFNFSSIAPKTNFPDGLGTLTMYFGESEAKITILIAKTGDVLRPHYMNTSPAQQLGMCYNNVVSFWRYEDGTLAVPIGNQYNMTLPTLQLETPFKNDYVLTYFSFSWSIESNPMFLTFPSDVKFLGSKVMTTTTIPEEKSSSVLAIIIVIIFFEVVLLFLSVMSVLFIKKGSE